MKKNVWIILAAIVSLAIFGIMKNNTMVELRGAAEKDWAKTQSAYQRRADLIGNLVKIVQGAADFERNTLREVMEARAKAIYNIFIRKFPNNIIASFTNNTAMPLFEAQEKAQNAPDINFNFN